MLTPKQFENEIQRYKTSNAMIWGIREAQIILNLCADGMSIADAENVIDAIIESAAAEMVANGKTTIMRDTDFISVAWAFDTQRIEENYYNECGIDTAQLFWGKGN